jgi:hypothetical protein
MENVGESQSPTFVSDQVIHHDDRRHFSAQTHYLGQRPDGLLAVLELHGVVARPCGHQPPPGRRDPICFVCVRDTGKSQSTWTAHTMETRQAPTCVEAGDLAPHRRPHLGAQALAAHEVLPLRIY